MGLYLVTCVRVLKSRDLMERSTSMHPMYCSGGTRSEQPPPAAAASPGQAMERRGGEEPGVSEKGPFDASSRALTPMHSTLSLSTPKYPIARPDPTLRPHKLICVLWLVPPW